MPDNTRWHESQKITENGEDVFVKKCDPGSFEFLNEIRWLSSDSICNCSQFKVPKIIDIDYDKGILKTEYIKETNQNISAENLINIAFEIHAISKSSIADIKGRPLLECSYKKYVARYFKKRLKIIRDCGGIVNDEFVDLVLAKIKEFKIGFFSIVHRDMYRRNFIYSPRGDVYLVDWEFSNISDPAQDVAKIIYENFIVNMMLSGLDYSEIEKFIQAYVSMMSALYNPERFRNRILAFVSIIAIEDIASRCHNRNFFSIEYLSGIMSMLHKLNEKIS